MADPAVGADSACNWLSTAASLSVDGPAAFHGRGIIIPAGGERYFPCAWICINNLRDVGCKLPIELWHLGPEEMTPAMRSLVEPLGVLCVEALEVRKRHPSRILSGWELKPYAMLHSRFAEVLLLDADNVVNADPSYLFDDSRYRDVGAIFWPDSKRLGPDRKIWQLADVPYRDEPEFESGQILVNKSLCLRELSLTVWMNEHSDFWYQYFHGDKETFHLCWRKVNRPSASGRASPPALSGRSAC